MGCHQFSILWEMKTVDLTVHSVSPFFQTNRRMHMLDAMIERFWDFHRSIIPHAGLQFLSLVLVFFLSKYREKKWYFPLWLALCALLFIPFVTGLEAFTAKIGRDTIIPFPVIIVRLFAAWTAYPMLLLWWFYPKRKPDLAVLAVSFATLGIASFLAVKYAGHPYSASIQIRSGNPEGRPVAGYKLKLNISNAVPKGKSDQLKNVQTKTEAVSDAEGNIVLPGWGPYATVFVYGGEGSNVTEYFISGNGNRKLYTILVSWPLLNDNNFEDNDKPRNQYLYHIEKKPGNLTFIIPIPVEDSREERYEAVQYRKMLSSNPSNMYSPNGYSFPANSILLQNAEFVSRMQDDAVKKAAIESAVKMLNNMTEIIERYLSSGRYFKSSAKAAEGDIRGIAVIFGGDNGVVTPENSKALLEVIAKEKNKWRAMY